MVRSLRVFVISCFLLICCVGAFAQAPVANFSSNITSGCSPIIVQFTDASTNNPTSWSWDLGNGTQATIQNPSTTYVTPGSYTVVLTASNASGSNTKTVANYIVAIPTPTVNFTVNDSSAACAPKAVQFTNLGNANSTGTATYYWDFGDGTTSTAQNPSHVYITPGVYSVTVLITNGLGCSKSLTKTSYITVLPKPASGFTITNGNSCASPVTATFTNTSTGAATYEWSFGDGGTSTATSPTHTYTAAGSYTVRLIAINGGGCRDTFISTAAVSIGNLAASFTQSATAACTRNAIIFTNTTTPGAGNSAWSFGDGTTSTAANPSHAYTTPGTYTVKLVVSYNNCADSVTHTVVINQGPSTQFTASPATGCNLPFAVSFSNATTGAASYLWDFGDGTATSSAASPAHSYSTYGSYTVRLITTSANGCVDTLIRSAYIQVAPVSVTLSGNTLLGCAPATLSLTAAVNTALPTTYLWNYGDGTSGATGSHSYAAAGTYTVTVTATTSTGCIATTTTTVIVGAHSVPGFTATPLTVCLTQPVSFTNTSTGTISSITYTWLFGEGGTSTQASPSYLYSFPGVYTPVLITDNNSCRDTFRRVAYITVNLPKAEFTTSATCANPHLVTFANTSVGATTSVWNFGDGSAAFTGTTPPVHNYVVSGSYTITLTVTNSSTGCTHTITHDIVVFDAPAAFSAAVNNACIGQSISFTAQSTPVSNYSSWSMDFGDGTSLQQSTPVFTHSYSSPGTYSVTLVATSIYSCANTLTKTNYITITGPTVSFISNTGTCPGTSVLFTDQSVTTNGIISSRTWRFGDGSSVTTGTSTTSHVYSSVGTYSVTLIVTDANGCKDSVIRTNYITVAHPVGAFAAAVTNGCLGSATVFSNTSTGVGPLSYSWTFGDGGTSVVASPAHTYAATGLYTVGLIVTDANGCKDTVTRLSYINISHVVAGFTTNDTLGFCPPYTVNLSNTSVDATSYAWDFGNGNSSTAANPTAVYTTSGNFTIVLRAYNAAGCIDSAKRIIHVNPGPSGTFTYTPVVGCLPLTITFTATTANTTALTWDFNNGITQAGTGNTITYTFTQRGIFIPKLILSNNNGCNVAVIGLDSIKVTKINAGFIAAPSPVCAQSPITFTDTSTAGALPVSTRIWDFGDATTATVSSTATSHIYAASGTYTVRLIAGTTGGCLDTAYRTVVVNPLPVIGGSGSQAICPGGSVTLTASGAASYVWSPAGGLSCTTCASPTASPTATTIYTVTATSAQSCVATKTITVTVSPVPTVSAGNAQTICGGTSAQLNATGAATYVWTPATGLSNPGIANPVANPTTTTTYTVTGTSAAGCSNTANVTVNVIPNPSLTISPNQTICMGGSATLTVSGAASYTWSPATGLSSTTASTVTATPTVTTTYTVLGNTVTNGCQTAGSVTVTVDPLPVVSGGTGRALCAGDSTILNAGGAATYVWSPATGLSCTTCANPTAKPIVTTTYTVTGTSAAGCVNTSTVTLTINPLPVVSAGADRSICAGTSATLTATGASTYVWTPATGLSNANIASPTANPTATTTYMVTGTSAAGCVNTDTVLITVNPLPVVSAGPAQFICPGSSTALTATGASAYVWSPATGLSCTACANPTASPVTTTTYTVTGTSADGCIKTSTVTVNVNGVPVITVAGNRTVCVNDSTQLTASGANSYTWTPATGLSSTTIANPYAKPAVTTTYTVTGTSGVGCTGTTTVTITVNPLPVVSAGADRAICAGTSTTLTATGASTYVWTPATGLSNANIASPTANPTATTTYMVTGTSALGCINTDTVLVTVNPLPVVSAGPAQFICPGSSTTLTATGASAYVWSPAGGLSCTACANPTASPVTTTTYTVTGTSADGCIKTSTVTVNVNGVPVITVAGNRTICVNDSTQLTASGANSYTWTPATGLSSTTIANPYAKPAATTTYTITGTSGVGCTGTTTVTITVNPLPVVSAGADRAICAGTSTTLTATGASTYVWTPATGLSNANIASPTANPTATTTYMVTGTSALGCINTDTVLVTVNPLPVVSAGPAQSICPGGNTILTATGAATYVWSPSTGLSCTACASPTASPATTTTYTVTGTTAVNCSSTSTVTVSVNAVPVVAITGNRPLCAGDSTLLTAGGANSFVWTPATGLSSATIASPYAKPAVTTTYTVTGTSGVGCTGTATVTVLVNPLPTVSGGPAQAICAGAGTTLTATGAATYVWTPATGLSNANIASPVATPAATTTYTVTGTSAAGCTGTATVVVTVNPRPTVATAGIAICPGGSGALLATGAVSYVWSPATGLSNANIASPVASPAATTTYTVTGTGANGCTATATATVTLNPVPVITVAGNRTICNGSSTTLTASGATAYVWTPATGLSNANIASPTANPTTTTTYTVTGTSGVGCSASTTVTITVNTPPTVSVTAPQTACAGTPVTLTATGAATYVWTPATGLSAATGTSVTATPAATTTYSITGTDAAGCSGTASTTVTINALPVVSAGPDTSVCGLTSAQLRATGAVSYVWTPAATLSSSTIANPIATPAVTTTYTVTGTGANGCVKTDAVTVLIYAQPPVNAGPDQTICSGQTAQLNATGAASYVWSPAATLTCAACPAPLALPLGNTTYAVTGTDIHGCRDSDRVVITIINRGPVSVGPGGDICEGESFQLKAAGGTGYAWTPENSLSNASIADPVARPQTTTTYRVVIQQGTCFTDTLSATVTVHPLPTVNAGPDQNVLAGSTVNLVPATTSVATYAWTPGDGLSCTGCANPVANPQKTTAYTLNVASDFGCTASDEVTIFVTCDGKQLWMPNTFTPNADGQNDRFYPHGRGITTVKRFRIYDRWGELIYDVTNMPVDDFNYGWDGTYKNQPLKPDVYVYIVNAECTTGEPLEVKGDISLLR